MSTQNGILKASKKYLLRFRADSVLYGNNFINYFDKFKNFNNKYKIFENKIIVSSIFTKEYSDTKGFYTPFFMYKIFSFWINKRYKKLFYEY